MKRRNAYYFGWSYIYIECSSSLSDQSVLLFLWRISNRFSHSRLILSFAKKMNCIVNWSGSVLWSDRGSEQLSLRVRIWESRKVKAKMMLSRAPLRQRREIRLSLRSQVSRSENTKLVIAFTIVSRELDFRLCRAIQPSREIRVNRNLIHGSAKEEGRFAIFGIRKTRETN